MIENQPFKLLTILVSLISSFSIIQAAPSHKKGISKTSLSCNRKLTPANKFNDKKDFPSQQNGNANVSIEIQSSQRYVPFTSREGMDLDRLVARLGPDSRILELGAGAGLVSLEIAHSSNAQLTLVDTHNMWISFLRVLEGQDGLRAPLIEYENYLENGTFIDSEVVRRRDANLSVSPLSFYESGLYHLDVDWLWNTNGLMILGLMKTMGVSIDLFLKNHDTLNLKTFNELKKNVLTFLKRAKLFLFSGQVSFKESYAEAFLSKEKSNQYDLILDNVGGFTYGPSRLVYIEEVYRVLAQTGQARIITMKKEKGQSLTRVRLKSGQLIDYFEYLCLKFPEIFKIENQDIDFEFSMSEVFEAQVLLVHKSSLRSLNLVKLLKPEKIINELIPKGDSALNYHPRVIYQER